MTNEVYIHDIPGRLRIRSEAMKNNERAAAAAQQRVRAIPGVLSTSVNLLTGSIIVTYDAKRLHSAVILNAVREYGYFDGKQKGCVRNAPPGQPSLLRRVVIDTALPKLGKLIVDWTVERALLAAVAALL